MLRPNPYKEKWMRLALSLAKKGEGKVSPNPMVGAVLVKDGKLIAKGYHRYFGGPHAEIEALKRAKDKAKGATLYVTLEPCSHYGKTPPCTLAIIKAGVSKVIAATIDPNPLNSGRGIKILREKGIETEVGICEEKAKKLNESFFKFIREKIPFVTVKAGASLDGKIATFTGESKWITGEKSREVAHNLRNKFDAILVGINTVIKDDPKLLPPSQRKFLRVILDSRLRVPLSSKVLKDQKKAPTLIFTTPKANLKKMRILKNEGIKINVVEKEEKVPLKKVLSYLGEFGIMSLLVEGGGEVIGSFFEENLVDKIYLFISPRIIGGKNSLSWVGGKGIDSLDKSPKLKISSLKRIDEDIFIEGYILKNGKYSKKHV
ncbi:bifunctional diaminohydroxyphosphoribosylaminopyrimidine deaminase/5-amino-6-(5-phosphoribosylamino)uracil reductase RibD [Candidatus Aerophobetes bacterium]|nr:bifunctional diaminohydroxyphosphoribosylaminopyrimidine deaminase/5-amino-6-(5-phosphoribosylamino)uracil reductase RibD [Candidatus Aerophobetes bacterium]